MSTRYIGKSHKRPPIEVCIEKKHSKSLYKQLIYKRQFLNDHPELRQAAIEAFITSAGYKATWGAEKIGMTYTDLQRLFGLVDRGIFTLDEIKGKIPKNNYQIMLFMNKRIPGWATNEEIVGAIDKSHYWAIDGILLNKPKLNDDFSKNHTMHSIMQSVVNSTNGLREALENFLLIKKIHET